ncbi:hypothetical protein KM043_007950 [Ampulex compressa]|nr:hypothetical protein KM043_007950 [Ampulex compressa]
MSTIATDIFFIRFITTAGVKYGSTEEISTGIDSVCDESVVDGKEKQLGTSWVRRCSRQEPSRVDLNYIPQGNGFAEGRGAERATGGGGFGEEWSEEKSGAREGGRGRGLRGNKSVKRDLRVTRYGVFGGCRQISPRRNALFVVG